tara:strand:- start:182 stop:427 length:246 start_codon:yes stop_codon:yes gene_type:complete
MNDIKQIYELALEVAKNLNHVPGIKKMELDLSPAEPTDAQLVIQLLQSMFEATANLRESNKGVRGTIKAIRRSEANQLKEL